MAAKVGFENSTLWMQDCVEICFVLKFVLFGYIFSSSIKGTNYLRKGKEH